MKEGINPHLGQVRKNSLQKSVRGASDDREKLPGKSEKNRVLHRALASLLEEAYLSALRQWVDTCDSNCLYTGPENLKSK